MIKNSIPRPSGARGGATKNTVIPSQAEGSRSLQFHSISSGKLRRYWDFRNFIDPFSIALGFFQSLVVLTRIRPCAVLTAGSYVAVPVAWAAWVLRIPVVMYQQDVDVGLANRLMLPVVSLVLCIRENSSKRLFPERSRRASIAAIGSLIRSDRLNGSASRARTRFNLEQGIPTLLVLGGGTGSQFLNQLITDNLTDLTEFCQIIHITGGRDNSHTPSFRGSPNLSSRAEPRDLARYHSFPFMNAELADCYAAADLVLTRAGMGVLTELAANKKAAVVIPLPDTHQEANARLLKDHDAALVLRQPSLSRHPEPSRGISPFVASIHSLLTNPVQRQTLAANLHALFPIANKKEVADLIVNHACSEHV